jgi:hypothetical protein
VSSIDPDASAILLDLVEWTYANGRSGWNIEREVVIDPDGSIRSKAPVPGNEYTETELDPGTDPIELIAGGTMMAITSEEFDRHWDTPMPPHRGWGERLLSWLRARSA